MDGRPPEKQRVMLLVLCRGAVLPPAASVKAAPQIPTGARAPRLHRNARNCKLVCPAQDAPSYHHNVQGNALKRCVAACISSTLKATRGKEPQVLRRGGALHAASCGGLHGTSSHPHLPKALPRGTKPRPHSAESPTNNAPSESLEVTINKRYDGAWRVSELQAEAPASAWSPRYRTGTRRYDDASHICTYMCDARTR